MEQNENNLNFNQDELDLIKVASAGGRSQQSEAWEDLGRRVLDAAKQELYLSMRYLFQALNSLAYQENRQIPFLATDGVKIYFNPMLLSVRYREDPVQVNRAFLHMVMHCLFRNMYSFGNRDHEVWDLACDMMAEYLIDDIDLSCVRKPESDFRTAIYKDANNYCKIFSAENIYDYLMNLSEEERAAMIVQNVFLVDDHRYWYHNQQQNDEQDSNEDQQKPNQQQEQEEKWNDTAKKVQTEMLGFGQGRGDTKGNMLKTLMAGNRKKVSYRDFLRKFAIMKEEMHVDMDSFDYGFYYYGMELYGNMPLIEELEYREENKIEDFVIALDTSGSCSYQLLQKFLDTTFEILTESESFFEKVNLHVIQCDNEVQSDTVIHTKEDVVGLKDNFQVKGFGGTDFRPVFSYIGQKQKSGELKKLRGLLYFTDGYGTFPISRPGYDTAFVFIGDYDSSVKVPGWAMRLEIHEDQLKLNQKGK